MPQFLITALGSYGDVHPMVGLGGALAARGHRVKVFTNPYFADVVSSAGLEFVPLGTRAEYVELSHHPDLWHPIRGPRMVLTKAAGVKLRPLYDLLMANYVAGETVYCAHVLDIASRIAAEKLGAPVASVLFAPAVLWSVYDSPRLKGALWGPHVPRWFKRMEFTTADRLIVVPLLASYINPLRAELGQPKIKRFFNNWLFDTDLVLGLFPAWFGPPQPDWPDNVKPVGFPLWDAPGDDVLPVEVQRFLACGSAPIAFSPGSANQEAHQFFEAAVDACARLGKRGILLTKYDHQLPRNLPETVQHFGFVPLSKLLQHTAALVHHGGVGTCGQGLAAGVPHVVRPMSYDQFDNARRLVRLGVAREISVRKFSGACVAAALTSLLDSRIVASRCRDLASRCNGSAALAAACDALEQLAIARLARSQG